MSTFNRKAAYRMATEQFERDLHRSKILAFLANRRKDDSEAFKSLLELELA